MVALPDRSFTQTTLKLTLIMFVSVNLKAEITVSDKAAHSVTFFFFLYILSRRGVNNRSVRPVGVVKAN